MYVYNKFTAQTGVTLPHKATYQANYGTPVDKEDLLPGDLVFFDSPISHVGMYVGNGLMINSPRSGDLVTIEDAYRTNYATARRLISPYTPGSQQTSSLLAYTGTWTQEHGPLPPRAAASATRTPPVPPSPSPSTAPTSQWMAKKSPSYGQASVTLDGKALGTVDLYSSSTLYVQKVWDTGMLAGGTHTVTIKWTGTRPRPPTPTSASMRSTSSAPRSRRTGPGVPTRYQETDAASSTPGCGRTPPPPRPPAGASASSTQAGSASITFNGTYLAWVAKKGSATASPR